MIDPREFINSTGKIEQQEETQEEKITGTFICQECFESIGFATLNEDTMVISYVCNAGHNNEATL